MSTTVSNVSTTEYAYNPSVQGGQGTSTVNSVFDEKQAQVAETPTPAEQTSELDKEIDKLLEQIKNTEAAKKCDIELNRASLKKLILENILGVSEESLIQKLKDEIENIKKIIIAAFNDAKPDKEGKVKLESITKLAKDYYVALKTGWSIEGFKNHNKNVKKSTLMERLVEEECLRKDATVENVTTEELETALTKFFNDTLLAPLKNAKTQKEKEQIYKGQLQTFGRLLINTPDDQKAIFKQAVASLMANNRGTALHAVLSSFETAAGRTAWADSMTVEEAKKITAGTDAEGNVPSMEDSVAMSTELTANKSEEGIKKFHEEFQKDAEKFFEEHKDVIAKIKNNEALTPEEEEIKRLYESFYTATSAGEFAGTAINQNIDTKAKQEILDLINRDAYELPNYKEVLKQVSEYIEKHPEAQALSPEKLLDKATNGNYSTIAKNPEAEVKAPAPKVTETTGATEITRREAPNTEKLVALRQQIAKQTDTTEEKPSFKVAKTSTSPIQENNNPVIEEIQKANTKEAKLEIIKNTFDKSPMLKKMMEKYVSNLTNPINTLNALPKNARKYLAEQLVKIGKLNEQDIENLNLSFSDKDMLHKMFQKIQEQKPTAEV